MKKLKFLVFCLVLSLVLTSCIKIVVPGNNQESSTETTTEKEKKTGKETEKKEESREESKEESREESKEESKETEESKEEEPEKAASYEALPMKKTDSYHFVDGKPSAFSNIYGLYIASSEDRFEKISRALQKDNKAAMDRFAEFRQNVEKAQGNSMGGQWSFAEYIYTGRMDMTMVSYVRRAEGYTGGAHGFENYYGVNLDTKTGAPLKLTDVMKDTGALSDAIIDNIEDRFEDEELNSNWRDTVKAKIAENELVYVLSGSGIEVFFEPYTLGAGALGVVTAVIPLKNCGKILKEEYVLPEEKSIQKIYEFGEQPKRDYSGDGAADYLNIELMYYTVNESDVQSVKVTYGTSFGEAKSIDIGNHYRIENVYLANVGEKTFVIAEPMLLNDQAVLYVIDLSDPKKGPSISEEYDFGFAAGASSTEGFYVQNYVESLGSFLGVSMAGMDENGKITLTSGYFVGEPDEAAAFGERSALPALSMYEFGTISVIKDVPAKTVSKDLKVGGDTVIKSGSIIRGYFSDSDHSLIVFDENENFYEITFEKKNYELFINGSSVYDYFSNLNFGS